MQRSARLLRSLTLIVVAGASAAGCGSPTAPASDVDVTFRRVTAGYYSQFQSAGVQLIRDEQAWKQVLQQLSPALGSPVAAVDFSAELVLVVTLGTRTSSGYSAQVERVAASGTMLTVHALEQRPAANCVTLTVITSPFEVVAVPRRSLSAEVTWRQDVHDCGGG